MKRNIVLMGPPGAGKGTLATALRENLHLTHISTGDMFREAIKEGTPLGKLAKSYLDSGALVPDEVTIGLVKERLARPDCESGFLLDGFPRTIPQAEALETLSKEINRSIEVVINLECEQDELIKRISGRRVCKNCGTPYHIINLPSKVEGVCDKCGGPLYLRADDNPEALKVRLDNYVKSTKPLLEFYDKRGLLENFDSDKDTSQIVDEVTEALNK